MEEKEMILKVLGNKELSSTAIYEIIKRGGYWKIVMLLKELENEGKIKKIQKGGWTYWKKNGKR